MTEYGKTVKKALIDKEMSQKQLCMEVSKKTGLYCDGSLLKRIFDGVVTGSKTVAAINEILDIQ